MRALSLLTAGKVFRARQLEENFLKFCPIQFYRLLLIESQKVAKVAINLTAIFAHFVGHLSHEVQQQQQQLFDTWSQLKHKIDF